MAKAAERQLYWLSPSKSKFEGNWIARATCEATRKYKHKKLGDYGSFAKHERFDVARKDAEKFFQLIENGENVRVISTVRDACLQYASAKLDHQNHPDEQSQCYPAW